MKILVTGSNGFVGRAVVAELELRGFEVRAAVRDNRRLSEVRCSDKIVIGDVHGETEWSTALDGVDGVIHLVARTHVTREQVADPIALYRKTNVEGTRRLAQEAARSSVKRFVFASSVKASGERTPDKPFSENDEPAPEDPYGISKLEAESALAGVLEGTGVEWTIVRPPLVYGPGIKANMSSLTKAVLSGVPLPLKSVVNQRSLVGVTNLADFLVECLIHPLAPGNVFFVSDGEDISIAELLRRIGEAANCPARLWRMSPSLLRFVFYLLGKRGVSDRLLGSLRVDISRAQTILGWSPKSTMAQELHKMVVDFNRNASDLTRSDSL